MKIILQGAKVALLSALSIAFFSCINQYGTALSDNKNAEILIFSDSPDEPTEISAVNILFNSARITWKEPNFKGNSRQGEYETVTYELQYSLSENFNNPTTIETGETFAELTGLAIKTQYWVRVRSRNASSNREASFSPYANLASPKASFSTLEARNLSEPSSVLATINPADASRVTLSWSMPYGTGMASGGVAPTIKEYTIEYSENSSLQPFNTITSTGTSVEITGLKAALTYYVRIKATNSRDEVSGYSSTYTFITPNLSAAPTANALNLRAEKASNAIVVKWDLPTTGTYGKNPEGGDYKLEDCTFALEFSNTTNFTTPIVKTGIPITAGGEQVYQPNLQDGTYYVRIYLENPNQDPARRQSPYSSVVGPVSQP